MKHLTRDQRYTISMMLENHYSKSDIAKVLKVDKSTITREIKRNCDKRDGTYRYELAERKSFERKRNKRRKSVINKQVKRIIKRLLRKKLSPEQISGRLKLLGFISISHETIYQYIWRNKRNKGKLYVHLRRQGRRYSKRGSQYKSRGVIPDRVDISERPKIVDYKERFGDLEIDTIIGKNHKGAIVTINDRATGKVWIRKLTGKEAAPLAKETIITLLPIKHLIHTITADNGKEFANFKEIEQELKINFYFCKPYHSWERGANENTNGLIRQYIPKKCDFDTITEAYIQMVETELNNRPRKRLGFLTPNEKFNLLTKLEKVAFAS